MKLVRPVPIASSKSSPWRRLPMPDPIAPAAKGLKDVNIPGSRAEPKKLPKRGSTILISKKVQLNFNILLHFIL